MAYASSHCGPLSPNSSYLSSPGHPAGLAELLLVSGAYRSARGLDVSVRACAQHGLLAGEDARERARRRDAEQREGALADALDARLALCASGCLLALGDPGVERGAFGAEPAPVVAEREAELAARPRQ